MPSLRTLSILVFSQFTYTLSPDTEVVIVSNNDLNPSNPNHTCVKLEETLLPLPISTTGLTSENQTAVLASDRHGTALAPGSDVWIAGNSGSSCMVFTVGNPSPCEDYETLDPSSRLSALRTNSAPLTRSNVTFLDTARQVDVSTPKAGILRGFRDKFSWRFLGIKYAESTAGQGRFQPPTPFNAHSNTVRTVLAYGPFCAQPPNVDNGRVLHTEEDCLTLNVYSPIVAGGCPQDAASKLPVMFYLSYGGVVLVTVNYCLNAFGWFNASNATLKDTLLALNWVQDNIEAFGGDVPPWVNPKYTRGLFSAAIVVSDFSTGNPFYSPAHALNTSLTLAKYLDSSYHLGISWDIVVDGDYVLNDIVGSIRDGVYSRVSTLWSATECDYCYFLPSTLSPTAPPSAYVQALSFYFNQSQIAKILGETSLYPYDTAPSAGGMSGAVITLGHLLTDWVVLCPSTYLAALESNTTNPGNAYHALFATGLGSPLTPNPAMCHGRVCHADELYLIFGTSETDGLYQPLTVQQVEVTRNVMKRFAEMAWTGSPNYEGAEIVWEGYGGGNEVVVDVTDSVKYGYRVAQCDFITNQLGLVYGDKMY